MTDIRPARMTHEHDAPIGVFLIGMRFNRLSRPDQWLPPFLAMPKMLTELYRDKAAAAAGEAEDLGFLGARTLLGGRGVTVVQYWRSVEDIYRYASAPSDHEHRPAWSAFNARARKAAGRRRHLARDLRGAGRCPREHLRDGTPVDGAGRGDVLGAGTEHQAECAATRRGERELRPRPQPTGSARSGDDDLVAEVDLAEQRGDPGEVTHVHAAVGSTRIPAGREVRRVVHGLDRR